eukprot:GEMP01073217.1.p1 GENE.GEMP01073217.1~~GEMP01073217.1.p1  ORF type:complete len:148 (-),score=24.65 GEMP01073217.1:512-955(-)
MKEGLVGCVKCRNVNVGLHPRGDEERARDTGQQTSLRRRDKIAEHALCVVFQYQRWTVRRPEQAPSFVIVHLYFKKSPPRPVERAVFSYFCFSKKNKVLAQPGEANLGTSFKPRGPEINFGSARTPRKKSENTHKYSRQQQNYYGAK